MSNSNKTKNVNTKVKKSKKQEKSRIGFLLLSVVLFIVILISTVFNDVVQIHNNKKQTLELQTRRDLLLEEEASLKSEVIKLQDPYYIERYAREKYLYTKDGDRILTIIDTPLDSSKNNVSKNEDVNNNE